MFTIGQRLIKDKGLRMYEILNKYRFKGIIVIDSGGKIHRHKHNG